MEQHSNNGSIVTNEDKHFLRLKYDIGYDEAIQIFWDELQQYLKETFNGYELSSDIKSLEDFNRIYLRNYPSSEGDAMMDGLFTGPNCKTSILSKNSKVILDYFYGISVRDE